MSLDHRRPDTNLVGGGDLGSPAANSLPLLFFTLTYDHLRQNLWATTTDIPPVLVPASTCYRGGQLRARPIPRGSPLLFADSGGYVFAKKYHYYPFSADHYVEWLRLMQPTYAAMLDYPCEPAIAPDRRAVRDRQRRTLDYAEKLVRVNAPWTWVPIVQGQHVDDYVLMARRYRAIGLETEYMGIGSLCARKSVHEIREIVEAVQAELPDSWFHLFGVKLGFFKTQMGKPLRCISTDTAAWNGRFGNDIPRFNAVMQNQGWTQDMTEIQWALPGYRARFYRAAISWLR